MAEVHVIGQIIGGCGFPSSTLFCRWGVAYGNGWKVIAGVESGQTQVDSPQVDDTAYWYQPIDLHLATRGLQGWPKLYFNVWHQDVFGRHESYGYGFCHVPSQPGHHDIDCVTWRPVGSLKEQMQQYFIGGGIQLRNLELVFTANDRYKMQTVAMGKIKLQLNIITRNFHKFGVEY